ncbi:MAG: NAD(+)/NADH kinase [Balneolia bacterium]|nr:NAD(+)/NADH kinase [Balneolia bacterium]
MKICLIVNPEIEPRLAVVRRIRDFLTDHKQSVHLAEAISERLPQPASPSPLVSVFPTEDQAVSGTDAVIAVGGDGTMLHTARLVGDASTPILGINSGRLGFLADTQLKDLESALSYLFDGNWEVEERFMLSANWNGNHALAFNEFLFAKHSGVAMITLEVYCNDQKINKYWADGLIIATPTGSTAYNLSSGGPVIYPETDVMVITPVCPHALTTRPLVLPADKVITVKAVPANQQILFSNDGKICNINNEELTDIEISKSSFNVRLIKLPGRNYFETLRAKLMWGKDLRE